MIEYDQYGGYTDETGYHPPYDDTTDSGGGGDNYYNPTIMPNQPPNPWTDEVDAGSPGGSGFPPVNGVNPPNNPGETPGPAGASAANVLTADQRIAALTASNNALREKMLNTGNSGGLGSVVGSASQAANSYPSAATLRQAETDPNSLTAAQRAQIDFQNRQLAQNQAQFTASQSGTAFDWAKLGEQQQTDAFSQWLQTQQLGLTASGQNLTAQTAGAQTTNAANQLLLDVWKAQTSAGQNQQNLDFNQWLEQQKLGLSASAQATSNYQISSNVDIANQQLALSYYLGQGDQAQGWKKLELAQEGQDLANFTGQANIDLAYKKMAADIEQNGLDAAIKRESLQIQAQVAANSSAAQQASAAAEAAKAQAALRGVEVQLQLGNGNLELGRAQLAQANELGLAQIALSREQLGEKDKIDTADLALRSYLGMAGIQVSMAGIAQQKYATDVGEQGANYRAELASATTREQTATQAQQARLQLLASLRGPRDYFQYLKVLRGMAEDGTPNGIAALSNGQEISSFQAPTGAPEAITYDSFLHDTGQQDPRTAGANIKFPTAPQIGSIPAPATPTFASPPTPPSAGFQAPAAAVAPGPPAAAPPSTPATPQAPAAEQPAASAPASAAPGAGSTSAPLGAPGAATPVTLAAVQEWSQQFNTAHAADQARVNQMIASGDRAGAQTVADQMHRQSEAEFQQRFGMSPQQAQPLIQASATTQGITPITPAGGQPTPPGLSLSGETPSAPLYTPQTATNWLDQTHYWDGSHFVPIPPPPTPKAPPAVYQPTPYAGSSATPPPMPNFKAPDAVWKPYEIQPYTEHATTPGTVPIQATSPGQPEATAPVNGAETPSATPPINQDPNVPGSGVAPAAPPVPTSDEIAQMTPQQQSEYNDAVYASQGGAGMIIVNGQLVPQLVVHGGGGAPGSFTSPAPVYHQPSYKAPVYTMTENKVTDTGAPNSYAMGARYIDHDQVAQIHKGEMVVPAAQNPNNPANQLPPQLQPGFKAPAASATDYEGMAMPKTPVPLPQRVKGPPHSQPLSVVVDADLIHPADPRILRHFGPIKAAHRPSFADGLDLAETDLTADVHKGEAIVPPDQNPNNPDRTQTTVGAASQADTGLGLNLTTTPPAANSYVSGGPQDPNAAPGSLAALRNYIYATIPYQYQDSFLTEMSQLESAGSDPASIQRLYDRLYAWQPPVSPNAGIPPELNPDLPENAWMSQFPGMRDRLTGLSPEQVAALIAFGRRQQGLPPVPPNPGAPPPLPGNIPNGIWGQKQHDDLYLWITNNIHDQTAQNDYFDRLARAQAGTLDPASLITSLVSYWNAIQNTGSQNGGDINKPNPDSYTGGGTNNNGNTNTGNTGNTGNGNTGNTGTGVTPEEQLTRLFGYLPKSPHEVPYRTWVKLLPTEKDVALAAYEKLGYAIPDVTELINRGSNPTYGSGANVAFNPNSYAGVAR